MSQPQWRSGDITALITEFFEQDDLQQLALDVGIFLDCPLLVLDDAYRVVAHFCPVGFSDPLFRGAVSQGAITYESSSAISKSPALREGCADMIKLGESPFRRRFAPLILIRRPPETPVCEGVCFQSGSRGRRGAGGYTAAPSCCRPAALMGSPAAPTNHAPAAGEPRFHGGYCRFSLQ